MEIIYSGNEIKNGEDGGEVGFRKLGCAQVQGDRLESGKRGNRQRENLNHPREGGEPGRKPWRLPNTHWNSVLST